MLSALRRNSLSVVLSTMAVTGYGAWLSLPESASIQSIYDRYIAREESRPRIFDEGISIRLNREAPPVAALEEALRDQPWTSIERSPGFNVRATELRIQPAAPERIAIRILSENEQFNRALEARAVASQVMTTPIAPPVVLPQHRPPSVVIQNRGGAAYVPTRTASANMRPLETLAPTASSQVIAQSRVISTSKTGLSREQILAALFGPMSQSTAQSQPTAVAVNSGSVSFSTPLTTKAKAPTTVWGQTASVGHSTTSVARPATSAQLTARDYASAAVVDKTTISDADASSVANRSMGMVAPAGRQIMIRGPIELSGGLALTHAKDRIAVLRESRGQFVESGAVWIREARYEIFVESLEGQLVAEVRSPQGDVVGRGRLELSSIVASNQKNLDGVALRVMPITPGIQGRVQSAYSTTGSAAVSKGVQGARIELLNTPSVLKSVSGGHFEDQHFTEGSRVVANIETKDHWPTLTTLTSGQESVVPVFSKKMMQAFVSLTSKDEATAAVTMKTTGVVWGRVTRAGQTVAGASVDVITHGTGLPVYFNDLMLPDATMKTTGSNGLFAIPAATTGVHAVQLRLGKRTSDPVFLQTDVESVSSLDLDVLKASEYPALAFDAFRTDYPLRAEVRPMGHTKARAMAIESDGKSIIRVANLGLPSVLEIDGGGDYLPTRMIQNPDTRHLYIPMVQRGWFDRIIGRIRYNSPAGTGTILGFVQGTRFRVSMDAKSLSANAKIVYFDSRGELTTSEFGEPGGGFILMGAENGLQTVLIESDGSDRVYAATVLVEDSYVASLSHWLR